MFDESEDAPPQVKYLSSRKFGVGGDGRKFGGYNGASRELGWAIMIAARLETVKKEGKHNVDYLKERKERPFAE